MPTYYRGAGVGTYWHQTDARLLGFIAVSPGATSGRQTIINHVVDQLTQHSPYVSLTRSYEVAETYAIYGGYAVASASEQAYVYEVSLGEAAPTGLSLIDPVKEIAASLTDPGTQLSYQHDGAPDVLLGLVDPLRFGPILQRPVKKPGGAATHPAKIADELELLVRALRDAEILAFGAVPAACVTQRYSVP